MLWHCILFGTHGDVHVCVCACGTGGVVFNLCWWLPMVMREGRRGMGRREVGHPYGMEVSWRCGIDAIPCCYEVARRCLLSGLYVTTACTQEAHLTAHNSHCWQFGKVRNQWPVF